MTLSCCFLTACRQLNGVGYHVVQPGGNATLLNSVRLPKQFTSTHKFIPWVGRVWSSLSKNTMQWLWLGLKLTLLKVGSGALTIRHVGCPMHPKCVESTDCSQWGQRTLSYMNNCDKQNLVVQRCSVLYLPEVRKQGWVNLSLSDIHLYSVYLMEYFYFSSATTGWCCGLLAWSFWGEKFCSGWWQVRRYIWTLLYIL